MNVCKYFIDVWNRLSCSLMFGITSECFHCCFSLLTILKELVLGSFIRGNFPPKLGILTTLSYI